MEHDELSTDQRIALMTAINRMVAKVYDRNCGDYAFVQQATPILQEIAVLTDALANAEDAGDRDEYETHGAGGYTSSWHRGGVPARRERRAGTTEPEPRKQVRSR